MFGINKNKLKEVLEKINTSAGAPKEEQRELVLEIMTETKPVLEAIYSGVIPIATPKEQITYLVMGCISFCLSEIEDREENLAMLKKIENSGIKNEENEG